MAIKEKTPQNLEIWEKHYTNKKGTKEPPESFQTFQKYLHTRNLRKLTEELIKEDDPETPQDSLKIAELVRKKYEQLKYYSKTYDFKNRAKAYDEWRAKKDEESLFVDYIRIKMKAMCSLEEVISICNMKLNTVVSHDDISEEKLKRITETIKIASDEAGGIMYDHKHSIESKHEINEGKGLANALFTEEELEEVKKKMVDDDFELDDDFSKFQ